MSDISRRDFWKGAAALAAGLALPTAAQAKPKAEEVGEPKWLKDMVEEVRADGKFPAMSGCVVAGERLFAAASGVRKLGDKTPVEQNDKFHLGSVAKTMTAALYATLVDQGKVKWDVTLPEMFPNLWKKHGRNDYRNVTPVQLLNHTSGMPYQPGVSEEETDRRGGDNVRRRRLEYVRAAIADEPVATPGGDKMVYGGGHVIVAAYLERMLDYTYETLIQRNVFDKLGMTTAGFGPMATPPQRVDGTWDHWSDNGVLRPIPPRDYNRLEARAPVGRNVHCSAADLGRFAREYLRASRGEGQVISKESYKVLTSREGDLWAPGWALVVPHWAKDTQGYWHNGSTGSNFALVIVAPGVNVAVAAMFNSSGPDGHCWALANRMAEHVLKVGVDKVK